MLMTPFRLIILRLINLTLGRIVFFSKLLKRILVKVLIKDRKDKYVASSKFFTFEELE